MPIFAKKGAYQMDKKQFINWGVSFGSLALLSGIMSYLGLSSANKTSNFAVSKQFPATNQNSGQSPSSNTQYSLTNSPNTLSSQSTANNNQSANNNIFSTASSFFTTTGGS